MSVAYPGPVGSHTASAAAALFPSAQLVPLAGFRAVADAVAGAESAHGVLPIESSLAGPVAETHDLLYTRALSIVAETVLPILHCLAGPEPVALEDVRVVRSHPTALDQCRDLLARLPHVAVLPVSTTAEAARMSAADGDPTHVAIVGPAGAELYGLTVIADDIGDHTAFTRFVSISPYTNLDVDRALARTAFSFVTRHQPGALVAAIEPFARAGLDLQRLVSQLKRYKDEHGIGFVDLAREQWMLQYLSRANRGPLSEEGLSELYHYVLDLTKQEVLKVSGV